MKQIKTLLVVLGVLMFMFGTVSIGAAISIPVTFTFTADNQITSWTIDGASQPLGGNVADWRVADTSTVNLDLGSHDIVWEVLNVVDGKHPNNWATNPAGLLAEIGFSGTKWLSSSSWWTRIGSDSGSSWYNAKEYGANNDSSTIWYQNNPQGTTVGQPVSSIDDAAQWIWDNDSYSSDNPTSSLWIKTSINVSAPAPVPEPATLLLLGTGLIGLAGLGRKKFKKNNMV